MRQSGRQKEMGHWEIAIGLDRRAQPSDRLLLIAKIKFGPAGKHAPQVDKRVVGAEAERLLDMRFGILGLAEQILAAPICACAFARFRSNSNARSNSLIS